MAKGIFITGTGTDVGKTFIAGLLVKNLVQQNKNVAYYKAAMSGNEKDDAGNLIPGDAMWVKCVSQLRQSTDSMCPYVYENAYSPHLASMVEGNSVEMEVVEKGYRNLEEEYDYLVMEGSGGITCPLRYDETKIMLEDVVQKLNLPCIIVADAGLGTINHVLLTVEYMRKCAIDIKGIIFNHFHAGSILERDNFKMCEELTGLKILATVSDGDTEICLDINDLF